MQKLLCSSICLLLILSAVTAQVDRPPLGIPNLGIKPLTETETLALAPLGIESIENITGNTTCPCVAGCSVVPVTLLSFEGMRKNVDQVNLFWKTTNELQNKGFEVQRSLGNTTDFAVREFVPAKTANAAVNKYELPDANSFAGISYYRLRQVDLDDRSEFSETIAIKGYAHTASLVVFPNPVAHQLLATIYAVKHTTALLQITDATQKRLYSQNITLIGGMNAIRLPAAHLPPGVYFIKLIMQQTEMLSARFIKL